MPIKVPVVQTGLEASIQAAAKKAGKAMKIDMGAGAKSIESLSQPLGRITGKADQFTKSMEAANARVLAFGASVGVLSAVSRGFKELVKTTIEVEKRLTSINSILGGTTAQLHKFKKEIFDVARNTEQSFDTVSQAALELSRQGLKAEVVVERLNDALILSRLSGLGASEAVFGLTAAVNSFRKEGISSAEVLNKLSAAAISAAVSEKDLIEGIKRSGSVAVQAGVSFDQLVGVITAVQEKTARGGAVIGNSFKTIFTRIQSLDKLKTMQNLGVEVTDAGGQVLGATKLIENLAKTLSTLPDAKRLQIAENLVGKFQIAPFLAILEDYNQKTSTAIRVTEIAANATQEAYTRNAVISKTLSHAINETVVSAQELADTLGKIGVTDNLRGILDFFNNLVGNINKVLEGDSLGSKFAKGIIKGIGGVLSGPGLAIFGAILAKLTIDLARFGLGSLKTFFGLNKAARDQVTLQGQIASTLLGNKGIQAQIMAIENSTLSIEQKRAAQTRFFTTALNEQLLVMTKMQAIAARVAPGVMAGTRGKNRGAGGYIPNFNATTGYGSEQGDINRGVGGAPKGARPVTMPNFNFGGGQRGTMVANTSEYVVPDFAGSGGSAIFNQDMVSSMGLPTGARKIGAARGYIPNFAINDREGYVMMTGQKGGRQKDSTVYTGFKKGEKKRKYTLQDFKGARKIHVPIYNLPDKLNEGAVHIDDYIETLKKGAATQAEKQAKAISGDQMPHPKNLKAIREKINKGSLNAWAGTIYELTLAAMLTDEEFKKYADTTDTSNFDLNLQGIGGKRLQKVYDMAGDPKFGEVKGRMSNDNIKSAGAKIFRVLNPEGPKQAPQVQKLFGKRYTPKAAQQVGHATVTTEDIKNYGDRLRSATNRSKVDLLPESSASGYIPSFAISPLDAAVNRENAAGVPINQIRVNQSGKLRNAGNPQGLAVTNTRDEPTGAIPTAAGGFVPNFLRRSEKLGLGKNPTSSENRQGSFAQFEAGASKAASSAYKMADTTHKASEGAEDLAEGSKKQGKAQRDLLGPIFAVQAGLSFLTSATEGQTSAAAQYTNIISDALGTATTAAFAGSALKDFGDGLAEGAGGLKGALGSIVGGLGGLTVAVGATFAAVKLGGELMDKWSGVTDSASLSMELVAEAAKKAAFRLDEFKPSSQRDISDEAEAILGLSVGSKFDKTDVNFEGFEFFGTKAGKLEKALKESVQVAILNNIPTHKIKKELAIITADDFVDKGEVRRVVKLFELIGEKGKEAVDAFLKIEDLSLSEGEQGIRFDPKGEFKHLEGKFGLSDKETRQFLKQGTESEFAKRLSQGGSGVFQGLRTKIEQSGGTDVRRIQDKQILKLRQQLIKKEAADEETRLAKVAARARINATAAAELLRVAIAKAKLDQNALDVIDEKILKAGILKNLSIKEVSDLKIQKKEAESDLAIRNTTFDTVTKIVAASQELTFVEEQTGDILRKVEEIRRSSVNTEEERAKVLQLTQELVREGGLEIQAQIGPLLNSLDIEKDKLALGLKRFKNNQNITAELTTQAALLKLSTSFESRIATNLTTSGTRIIREGISRKEQELERAGIGPRSGFQGRQLGQRAAREGIENAKELQRVEQLERENAQRNQLRSLFNSIPPSLREQGTRESPAGGRVGGLRVGATGADVVAGLTGHDIARRAQDIADRMLDVEQRKAQTELTVRGEIDMFNTSPEKRAEMIKLVNKEIRDTGPASLKFIESLSNFADTTSNATSEAARLNEKQNENLKITRELADTYNQLNLSQVASDFLDALVEGRAQSRFDALTSTDPTAELKFGISERNFDAKTTALEINKETGQLVRGEEGLREFREILKQEEFSGQLIDASYQFAQNIGAAMVDAIARGEDLKSVLTSAATTFLNALSSAYMNKAVDQIVGGIGGGGSGGGGGFNPLSFLGGLLGFGKKARGGLITGGSGSRDDIPTLLTDGEFVIRKGAVAKYGAGFLEELNTGRIGQMQRGGLYSPGTYGQGAISGKRDLLDFATQSHTSGQFDQIRGGAGFGSVSLEPQSGALTMFGRRNSASFQKEQQSKGEAFGLFVQQIKAEEAAKEAKKQQKKGLMGALMAAVITGTLSTAFKGKPTANPNQKGILKAGSVEDGEIGGGGGGGGGGNWFTNLFSGIGDKGGGGLSSSFSGGTSVGQAFQRQEGAREFGDAIYNLGGNLRNAVDSWWRLPEEAQAQYVGDWRAGALGVSPRDFARNQGYAHGGSVPHAAGIDTVPTMLSGGEFVMNAAATQNIGRGNLAALNSGGGGEGSDGAVVARLDELIAVTDGNGETVINITVNSDGTETQDNNGDEQQQNLAIKIKDVVRSVIEEEQRLGGSLRRP